MKLKGARQTARFFLSRARNAGRAARSALTWALDARQYRIDHRRSAEHEERAYHYLWRFFRHFPESDGRITISTEGGTVA